VRRRGFVRWFALTGASVGLWLSVTSLRLAADARAAGAAYHGGGEFLLGFPTSVAVGGLFALGNAGPVSPSEWTAFVLLSLVGNSALLGIALGLAAKAAWRAIAGQPRRPVA
jgi:hypothetical protein